MEGGFCSGKNLIYPIPGRSTVSTANGDNDQTSRIIVVPQNG